MEGGNAMKYILVVGATVIVAAIAGAIAGYIADPPPEIRGGIASPLFSGCWQVDGAINCN